MFGFGRSSGSGTSFGRATRRDGRRTPKESYDPSPSRRESDQKDREDAARAERSRTSR